MENKEKLSKFSVVLAQLRKERGISQKKAADDLGISQALLSHYEKGIRECGLDFVVKCADYYGVTTDYLLGVSESRNGMNSEYLSEMDVKSGKSITTLADATKFLLNVAAANTSVEARNYIYDYYMLSVYRGALTLAKAGILPRELFKLDYTIARDLASAAIAVHDAKFVLIEDKSRDGEELVAPALTELIEQAEEYILENYIL